MAIVEECISDLKKGEATIIECPECEKNTFIGVGQGYTSDDKPYPVGNCCVCDMKLRNLDDSTDVTLMMDFRNKNWDKWVLFCMKQGYTPIIEGD